MDTTAHRILKNARVLLVDGLANDATPHGLSDEQKLQLYAITRRLWELIDNDPAPPDCQECATPIEQPATGRPRRFCGDACRQRNAYYADLAQADAECISCLGPSHDGPCDAETAGQ